MSLKSQKLLFLKKPIIFLFISLIKSLSCSDDLITVRRNQPNLIHHKNGDFILKIENYEEEYGWGCCSGARALLENLTNFDLYKFPPDSRGITYYHYNSFEYKKYWHPNSIEIETNDKVYSNNAVNHIVCKILYYTKYISHMIYSVSIDKDYNPYLLNFGGTLEQNISQSDMKKIVTFKKNDTLTEVYINGEKIFFEGKYNIIFSENISNICLPHELFHKFNGTLLNKCYKKDNYYSLKDLKDTSLPEIIFKIGNKNIILNISNYLFEYALIEVKKGIYDYYSRNFYLFIQNEPCDNFIFGDHFLYLFDLIEFNLETGDTSFYISGKGSKKGKYIIYEEDEKKVLYNATSCIELFIIISFILFSIFLVYTKKNNINKIGENFDFYLEI